MVWTGPITEEEANEIRAAKVAAGWVRLRERPSHLCPFPSIAEGELWRCFECRRLWRTGLACDVCDAGMEHHGGGQCLVGDRWRPARLGQRLRYWRKGRP